MEVDLISKHKRNKKRLTEEQVRLLERSFGSNKKLMPELKLRLAAELGIPARQVAVWYQNKRARYRTQSLELDCAAMRLRLNAALEHNALLQRELDHLRRHLTASTEAVELSSAATAPATSSGFGGGDDEGHGQVLEFDHDELFSLIHGSDDSYEYRIFP